MMKKFMMMAVAALCCAMTMTVFTACGDDDEDTTPKPAEILGIGGKYIISVTEQMAQLCDYTMTYYDKDNQLKTEKATWTVNEGIATWEKMMTSTIIPATFGIKINVKIKDDAKLDGVSISNIYPVTKMIYLEGVTTDAQKAWGNNVTIGGASNRTGTSGEKLPEYIGLWEKRGGLVNNTYTFDKDGNQLSTGSIE